MKKKLSKSLLNNVRVKRSPYSNIAAGQVGTAKWNPTIKRFEVAMNVTHPMSSLTYFSGDKGNAVRVYAFKEEELEINEPESANRS